MTQSRSFYAQVQAAADLLATSVIVLDRFARVRWCNSAAESLVGCSRRSLKGSDIGLLIPQVREWVERFSDKDAKYAPYSAVTELCRPLVEPEPVHASISVLTGTDGFLILELTQVERVIEQARQEREAGMSDASRSLLRNLAHEVKNPLGGIRGAAQLLESELTSSEQREFTEVIIAEADRLQALVDRLLVPYRRQRILTDVNLHEVLERARNLVLAEFSHGLTVTRDYDVSVPAIKGDAEQLIQVFLNLMRNAAEATRHLFDQ
ncbi:MAG: nitrogen regulation protein NR(II), partial [Duodenibacillus sp.]